MCVDDLEDELIRALGVDGVEAVLDRQGELASFRRLQRQPAQRDRPVTEQLHRFLGTPQRPQVAVRRAAHRRAVAVDAVPSPLARALLVAS